MNTTHVMSSIKWHDVINCGCDTLYSVSDVLHIVGAMSYIKMCDIFERVGGYTGTVAVMVQTQLIGCCIQYDGYDVDIYRG